MAGTSLKQKLLNVAKVLTKLKIDYAIIGGLALSVWAKPRATYDLDFLTSLTKENLPLYLESLKKVFIVPQEKPIEFRHVTFLRMLTEKDLTVIDLVFADDQYKKMALRNRIQIKIGNRKLNFISAEDLIIFKLLSGREQDELDIKGIIEYQKGSLDLGYLRKIFKKFKLERRFNEYFGK
ncbi:MAG: nucleotidyl transferase AbiEii/AbiGii toxin family protein [candidate division WOR-3 bacterium]